MPLYFFDVCHGKSSSRNDQGLEFPDDQGAWEEATTACGEIIRDLDGEMKASPDEWRMDVTNGEGKLVYRLRFSAEIFNNVAAKK
jgi:hypothetical protein